MPGTLLFAIILMVIAVAALAARRFAAANARPKLGVIGGILGGLAVILTVLSSCNPVGTRDVGVVTSFGRLAGHVGPGINWTAPWETVTSIDDSYQLTDETFTVRIAGGQTAQATVLVRWNAAPPAADDIFANFKTTAGMDSGLLRPELNVATNTVLDGYDPLTPLATGAEPGTPREPVHQPAGRADRDSPPAARQR